MGSWFELRDSASGEYHFVLKAAHGEVLARGGPFRCWTDALDGIEEVRRMHPQAHDAGIVSMRGYGGGRPATGPMAGSTGVAAL